MATSSEPSTRPPLEARVIRFLSGLPTAEVIDDLELPLDPDHPRKADFLLAHRQVIVELKTLTDDPSYKVEATAALHRDRDEWPLFYGKADSRKLLRNLPDGEAIYSKMANAIGRSVEAAVRSAEEQITDTRHVLNLPEAAGLLVILNESVDILDPYVVGHRVAQLMRRPRTGTSTIEKVDFVWLLFESHSLGLVHGVPAVPSMLISGERKERFPWFSAFHHDVVRRWSEANGGVSIQGEAPDPAAIRFVPTKETGPAPQALSRDEVWRRQYRAQPYLRGLDDGQVLARGSDIRRRLDSHFMRAHPLGTADSANPLLEEFAHFLEEVNFRGLDMRRVPRT